HIMRLVVGVNDRSFRVLAHPASPEKVYTKLLLVDRESPMLLGARSIQQFAFAVRQPVRQLHVVGMILVRHPQRRQAPSVFQVRIDGKAVIFHWQRSTMAENFKRTREIVGEERFEILPPTRAARRQAAKSKTDRRYVVPRVEAATAHKTNLVGVE